MKAHPAFETLLDFVENRLSQATRQQVMEHLASPCVVCQADVQAISDLLYLLQAEPLSEAPSATLRRAIRLFRRLQERPRTDTRLRLIAHLVFDSRLVPSALAAARGVGGERQMLYTAEGLDIDLQVNAENDQRTIRLMGQVMPVDDDPRQVQGRLVRLRQEDEVAATATTDELGTFSFRAITPGDYELWLELPHVEVWIPYLALGLTETI